jgi:hypothetical protein
LVSLAAVCILILPRTAVLGEAPYSA